VFGLRKMSEDFCLAPTGKSPLRTCAILSHQEGRLAIATNAGQGAVDADPLAWRARDLADGEAVWSRRPDAGVNSRQCFALCGDGDNKARFTRESAEEAVKTIAQGMPV
jgi:hypothetical protein